MKNINKVLDILVLSVIRIISLIPIVTCYMDKSYTGIFIYLLLLINVINPFISNLISPQNRTQFEYK